MVINAGKCAMLRFGPRFAKSCAPVNWQGNAIKYCEKAKYLGVTLCSRSKFSVDVSCTKTKFYRSFNSLFYKASKFHDDLVMHATPRFILLSTIFNACH